MIRTSDTRSLTEFCENTTAHLERLAEQGAAEVLTVNGQARGVVMSPQTFDALLNKAALADSLGMVDNGIEAARAERGRDFREAICGIADELGLKLDKE